MLLFRRQQMARDGGNGAREQHRGLELGKREGVPSAAIRVCFRNKDILLTIVPLGACRSEVPEGFFASR